jgi:hypothetical protein
MFSLQLKIFGSTSDGVPFSAGAVDNNDARHLIRGRSLSAPK